MYKPPENSNRVKAIKSKFEENSAINGNNKSLNNTSVTSCHNNKNANGLKNNKEKNSVDVLNNGIKDATPVQLSFSNLSRQLSDPSKRNIKRTPAFRLDSHPADEKDVRLIQNRSRYLEKRRDSSVTRLIKNCDNSFNNNFNESIKDVKVSDKQLNSMKFLDLRNKFDTNCNNVNNNDSSKCLSSKKDETVNETSNIALLNSLYTEPIPKHLRPNRNVDNKSPSIGSDKNELLNADNNKSLTEIKDTVPDTFQDNCNKITNNSVVKSSELHAFNIDEKENHKSSNILTDKNIKNVSNSGLNEFLTDTLKSALKKPLPPGPAPKKPPRTFTHTPKKDCDLQNNLEKNVSSLHLDKTFTKKLNFELQKHHPGKSVNIKSKTRGDPLYMLDRLENALKNNKARLKRIVKKGSISEDDSDDNSRGSSKSPSFKSNSNNVNNNCETNNSPSPISNQIFNLNCLNSFRCTNTAYEKVREPNSSFFVSHDSKEEPVYAEPFEFRRCTSDGKLKHTKDKDKEKQRKLSEAKSLSNVQNSLHYASNPIPGNIPVLADNDKNLPFEIMLDLNHQEKDDMHLYDTTSFSSACTSDMESSISTPSEENKTFLPTKRVKDMISVFESPPQQNVESSRSTKTSERCKTSSESKNKPETKPGSDKIKESIERLEILENHFKKTLGRTNDTKNKTGDSAYATWASHSSRNKRGSATEITKKFEIYVKRVRSKVYSEPFYKRDAFKHLFDCCLLVGLNGSVPYIKSQFPEVVKIPQKIEELCFPDAQSKSMDLSEAAQCYSLVITNETGERTFGYCRRVLPEGSNTCLPLAYCILSRHRAPGFYKKILQELESRHGLSEKAKSTFLNELYNSRFPKPGETVRISLSKAVACTAANCKSSGDDDWSDLKVQDSNGLDLSLHTIIDRLGEYGTINRKSCKGMMEDDKKLVRGTSVFVDDKLMENIQKPDLRKSCSSPILVFEEPDDCLPSELVFMRPSDTRHEENNLQMLYSSIPTNILQQIFSSLLLERKVIIVSSVLSKISSCIEALQVTLYPFSWPHTLIPVLPQCLWEILEAPTPLLCGVLSKEVVNMYKIENGMVVDLDEGSVLLKEGDEDKILRWTLLDIWKDGLSLAKSIPAEGSAQNVLLGDAFLRVFIKSCGHYKDHIVDGEFQKTSFIESGKLRGRGVRSFLTWFTETTMFYSFIDSVLNNRDSFRMFDQRIEIYSSEAAGDILKKMKERPKEKSAFFWFGT